MLELSLREITRDNWCEALLLAVYPEQHYLVAEEGMPVVALALAKAYIRPDGRVWIPYAFYANTDMIGFVALAYEPGSAENYWLCHYCIDYRYQGQGYGKKALQQFIQFIKDHHPQCRLLQLAVLPQNDPAQDLYKKAGFRPTGATLGGELVYALQLRP